MFFEDDELNNDNQDIEVVIGDDSNLEISIVGDLENDLKPRVEKRGNIVIPIAKKITNKEPNPANNTQDNAPANNTESNDNSNQAQNSEANNNVTPVQNNQTNTTVAENQNNTIAENNNNN